LPYPASGEDRALADILLRHDIPIRHDPDIVVVRPPRWPRLRRRGRYDPDRNTSSKAGAASGVVPSPRPP
jgi:hypothetical protein